MLAALLAALLGATLLTAAGRKLADPTGMAVGAETYGLRGRAARSIWLPLAAVEASLAAGILAGPPLAALAAAAVLGVFAVVQAAAMAAGRSGAPCGCFGARGRLSWWSVTRTALLASAAVVLGLDVAGSASAPAATAGALVLTWAMVLRTRRPEAALEVEGEGPALGARPGLGDDVRLAFFTAPGCRLCRALAPQAKRIGATVFDEIADAAAWSAAAVPGAPFAVALGADGRVLAKGTVNTRRQLVSVLVTARARDASRPQPGSSDPRGESHSPITDQRRSAAFEGAHTSGAPPTDPGARRQQGSFRDRRWVQARASSRRGFLASASAAVAVLTAGRTIGSLVAPGDADAFHFCGHIFTTDGCPHPTGLPRIDRNGLPLRARDGKPVDDLGRLVDAAGAPVDEAGAPLLDPDGRPQPPARRRRICLAAGRRHKVRTQTEGSWYRCCDGHVRKLVDCCTTNSSRRINGDRALRGYCYRDHKVFCVMYFQTKVPC